MWTRMPVLAGYSDANTPPIQHPGQKKKRTWRDLGCLPGSCRVRLGCLPATDAAGVQPVVGRRPPYAATRDTASAPESDAEMVDLDFSSWAWSRHATGRRDVSESESSDRDDLQLVWRSGDAAMRNTASRYTRGRSSGESADALRTRCRSGWCRRDNARVWSAGAHRIPAYKPSRERRP